MVQEISVLFFEKLWPARDGKTHCPRWVIWVAGAPTGMGRKTPQGQMFWTSRLLVQIRMDSPTNRIWR